MVALACMEGGVRRGAAGTVLLWRMVGARVVHGGGGMQEGHALIAGACMVALVCRGGCAVAHMALCCYEGMQERACKRDMR